MEEAESKCGVRSSLEKQLKDLKNHHTSSLTPKSGSAWLVSSDSDFKIRAQRLSI